MSSASDDLVPLFDAGKGSAVGFRQGVVMTWDPLNAANSVFVAGATLTDLPILNTNEALLLQPGSVVGILTAGSSWFILGRITTPRTPEAASALQMVSGGVKAAQKLGTVNTSSTAWQSLTGPVVETTIGSSGKALIIVGASLNYGTTNSTNTEGGQVGCAVSGATASSNLGTADDFFNVNMASTVGRQLTHVMLVEGFNPGVHTFTHQVAAFVSGRVCNFDRRSLVVFAL